VATDREWAEGYLGQARADLAGARAMAAASPSTLAMLWQMVFEKFAKAALLRQGAVPLANVRGSHKAASRLLHAIRIQKSLSALFGGTKVWEDVLWFVGALEAAHPQLAQAGAPQLEYPWEHVDGRIQWPAAHRVLCRRGRLLAGGTARWPRETVVSPTQREAVTLDDDRGRSSAGHGPYTSEPLKK